MSFCSRLRRCGSIREQDRHLIRWRSSERARESDPAETIGSSGAPPTGYIMGLETLGGHTAKYMFYGFELYGFERGRFRGDSPGLGEISRLQEEVERIHSKLEEFLPAQEARETAMQVYRVALDIDEEIHRILKDPWVGRLYQYDGQFFTPRGTPGFHTAFDGLHILKSLEDCKIETFFRGRKMSFAIWWLLEELGRHSWVAKRRRMNWEESGTLGLLTKDV